MGQQTSKPGIQTSEFWITLINSIVGILISLGYLTPQQGNDLVQAVVAVIGGALVIISTSIYVWGRIQLKKKELQSGNINPSLPVPEVGSTFINADPSGKMVPMPSK